MEFEPVDEFERELREALVRRPAPPSLKKKIMARRGGTPRPRRYTVLWQRLAACLVLAGALGGAAEWQRHVQAERRKGEAAREQVLTALRITGQALNHMNTQLAAHGRGHE